MQLNTWPSRHLALAESCRRFELRADWHYMDLLQHAVIQDFHAAAEAAVRRQRAALLSALLPRWACVLKITTMHTMRLSLA